MCFTNTLYCLVLTRFFMFKVAFVNFLFFFLHMRNIKTHSWSTICSSIICRVKLRPPRPPTHSAWPTSKRENLRYTITASPCPCWCPCHSVLFIIYSTCIYTCQVCFATARLTCKWTAITNGSRRYCYLLRESKRANCTLHIHHWRHYLYVWDTGNMPHRDLCTIMNILKLSHL